MSFQIIWLPRWTLFFYLNCVIMTSTGISILYHQYKPIIFITIQTIEINNKYCVCFLWYFDEPKVDLESKVATRKSKLRNVYVLAYSPFS